jgi:hypothetical protein
MGFPFLFLWQKSLGLPKVLNPKPEQQGFCYSTVFYHRK